MIPAFVLIIFSLLASFVIANTPLSLQKETNIAYLLLSNIDGLKLTLGILSILLIYFSSEVITKGITSGLDNTFQNNYKNIRLFIQIILFYSILTSNGLYNWIFLDSINQKNVLQTLLEIFKNGFILLSICFIAYSLLTVFISYFDFKIKSSTQKILHSLGLFAMTVTIINFTLSISPELSILDILK